MNFKAAGRRWARVDETPRGAAEAQTQIGDDDEDEDEEDETTEDNDDDDDDDEALEVNRGKPRGGRRGQRRRRPQ